MQDILPHGAHDVTTACCIVPPVGEWDTIQSIRRIHDPAMQRWPPHINLLFPFLPLESFEKAAALAAATLKGIKPFRCRLNNRLGIFSHRDDDTLYIQPETDNNDIHSLQAKLFQSMYPKQQQKQLYTPHLTLGKWKSHHTAQAQLECTKRLKPFEWNVSNVLFLSRNDKEDAFRVRARIELGTGRSWTVDGNGKEKMLIALPIQDEKEKEKEKDEKKYAMNHVAFDPMYKNQLYLSLNLRTEQIQTLTHTHQQFYVLDRSGSMGNDWATILRIIAEIDPPNSEKKQHVKPIYLTYASSCEVASSMAALQKTEPDGQTDFVMMLLFLMEQLASCKADKISVVIMTDGADTVNEGKAIDAAVTQFAGEVQQLKQKNITVHAIGFTSQHDLKMLERLQKSGKQEGVFRYAAHQQQLDEKFMQLFDFLETTTTVPITLIGIPVVKKDAKEDKEDKHKHFITCRTNIECDIDDDDETVYGHTWLTLPDDIDHQDELNWFLLLDNNKQQQIPLPCRKLTPLMIVRRLAAIPLTTLDEVNKVRSLLQTNVKPFGMKMKATERKELFEEQALLQQKLDKFYRVLAASIQDKQYNPGVDAVARLRDLRYDAKLSKPRRQRNMDQRAVQNSAKLRDLDHKLNTLQAQFDPKQFAQIPVEEYMCELSCNNVLEMMQDDPKDVMCLCLTVTRPEHVIDAPTLIVVNSFSPTFCSRSAAEMAILHKVGVAGQEAAHGGFLMQGDNNNKEAPAAAFVGRAREPINAILPLYINESHWKRVEMLMEPLLGYFFTLDPLGYHPAQILGLYTILGHMLHLMEKTERERLILREFRSICVKMLPKARAQVGFAVHQAHGKPEDLLELFLRDPVMRTKAVLPNLHTLLGWMYCLHDNDPKVWKGAFLPVVQEAIRRQLNLTYTGATELSIQQILTDLLYGNGNENGKNEGKDNGKENEKEKEQEKDNRGKEKEAQKRTALEKKWADWARYKCALGAVCACPYEEDSEYDKELEKEHIDRVVQPIDTKHPTIQEALERLHRSIIMKLKSVLKVFERMGVSFTTETVSMDVLRGFYVQGLLTHKSDDFQRSNTKQTYYVASDVTAITGYAHAVFVEKAKLERQNLEYAALARVRAQRIVRSKEFMAFIGRMMRYVGSRGGKIWDELVCGLSDPTQKYIPDHVRKVQVLFWGQVQLGAGNRWYPVFAQGIIWIPDSNTVQRFRDTIGNDEIIVIENQMRGKATSWVYRESDIRNRHGHSNSHPNPLIAGQFSGFR